MKQLKVKEKDGSYVNLQFDKITQLFGLNGERKDFILDTIAKHFSKHRYNEDETIQSESVKLAGEEVGRSYFETQYIYDILDIEANLSFTKTSLLREFVTIEAEQIAIIDILEQMNRSVQSLMDNLNIVMQKKIDSIFLSTDDYTIDEFLKKKITIDIENNEHSCMKYLDNSKKLEMFLNLLEEANHLMPKKRLIILRNIDMYINQYEYLEIMLKIKEITDASDCWFIVTTSKIGYGLITDETIEGINVINDSVFNVPSLDVLKEFIESKYPVDKTFEANEFIEELTEIIQQIGQRTKLKSTCSQVLLKTINIAEYCEVIASKPSNSLELAYIQSH
jgi:hypothetical protein